MVEVKECNISVVFLKHSACARQIVTS